MHPILKTNVGLSLSKNCLLVASQRLRSTCFMFPVISYSKNKLLCAFPKNVISSLPEGVKNSIRVDDLRHTPH